MDSTRSRRLRLAAACLAAAGAVGTGGCKSGSLQGEPVPAPAAAGREFEEIGERPLAEVVSPASYLLVRCGYQTAGGARHLNVRAPIDDPAARADLARVLAAVEEARGTGTAASEAARTSASEAATTPAVRTYELAVGERWIADLDLEDRGDPGRAVVIGRLNGRPHRVEVEAPALLRALRRLSLAALQASRARPRRPLDWSHEALAGFLGALQDPAAEEALRRELLATLGALPDPAPLAEALVARASAFEPEEVRRLGRGEVIGVRVLELASAAWRGRREALREILTLALEYHGQERLFAGALRSLFPPPSNGDLHARHAVPGNEDDAARKQADLAFANEVRLRLGEARPLPEGGWTLAAAGGPGAAR